jgi:hypothetical protein
MVYLYYNARHKVWSQISRFSYDIKRRCYKTEMNEGDKVAVVIVSPVKQLAVTA